jgi:hypothetical protein
MGSSSSRWEVLIGGRPVPYHPITGHIISWGPYINFADSACSGAEYFAYVNPDIANIPLPFAHVLYNGSGQRTGQVKLMVYNTQGASLPAGTQMYWYNTNTNTCDVDTNYFLGPFIPALTIGTASDAPGPLSIR